MGNLTYYFSKKEDLLEGAFKRYSGNFFREHPAV
ncbi:MAG: hypothetical protein ACLRMN_16955 [Mediterraneibacter gnavus]